MIGIEQLLTEQKEALSVIRELQRQLYLKDQLIEQLNKNHAAMLNKKSSKIKNLDEEVQEWAKQVEKLQKPQGNSHLKRISYAASVIGIGLLVASAASSFTGIGVAIAPLLLIAGAVFAAIGLGLNLIDSKRKTSTVFKDTQKIDESARNLGI